MLTVAPAPADPRMLSLLAEAGFGAETFNPRQHRSCELVDLYVLRLAIHLTGELGLEPLHVEPCTARDLLRTRGFAPAFQAPLVWLLEWLACSGVVRREGTGEPLYSLVGPLPDAGLAAARAEGIASDPSYEATYEMLDEAAAVYPKVAAGEVSGERALFHKVNLWTDYFSNTNGYYALNNRVGAVAASERLPRDGGRILEVGAGLGSATAALLDRLDTRAYDLASYRVTEPVPFFRRRAERMLGSSHPDVPLRFSALDINQPWEPQDVAPSSWDLVWGVNVFHLARRLESALDEARRALAPGGWIVVGEGLRPASGLAVAAEFPFQLLDSFVGVELDPLRRPTAGFLTAEQWRGALEASGFSSVAVVPDVARLVEIHRGFYAAAVCGRR